MNERAAEIFPDGMPEAVPEKWNIDLPLFLPKDEPPPKGYERLFSRVRQRIEESLADPGCSFVGIVQAHGFLRVCVTVNRTAPGETGGKVVRTRTERFDPQWNDFFAMGLERRMDRTIGKYCTGRSNIVCLRADDPSEAQWQAIANSFEGSGWNLVISSGAFEQEGIGVQAAKNIAEGLRTGTVPYDLVLPVEARYLVAIVRRRNSASEIISMYLRAVKEMVRKLARKDLSRGEIDDLVRGYAANGESYPELARLTPYLESVFSLSGNLDMVLRCQDEVAEAEDEFIRHWKKVLPEVDLPAAALVRFIPATKNPAGQPD